jgi:hypothetical protein
MFDANSSATTSSDVCVGDWEFVHTAFLNALHGSARDSPVNGLGGILDGLDGALASNGGGEQAGLAGDVLTEHGGGGGV